jgi:hypothetical protein
MDENGFSTPFDGIKDLLNSAEGYVNEKLGDADEVYDRIDQLRLDIAGLLRIILPGFKKPEIDKNFLETPISSIVSDARTLKWLQVAKFEFVGDLIEYDDNAAKLLPIKVGRFKGLGRRSVAIVEEALKKIMDIFPDRHLTAEESAALTNFHSKR